MALLECSNVYEETETIIVFAAAKTLTGVGCIKFFISPLMLVLV